jgi:hypothetical protein
MAADDPLPTLAHRRVRSPFTRYSGHPITCSGAEGLFVTTTRTGAVLARKCLPWRARFPVRIPCARANRRLTSRRLTLRAVCGAFDSGAKGRKFAGRSKNVSSETRGTFRSRAQDVSLLGRSRRPSVSVRRRANDATLGSTPNASNRPVSAATVLFRQTVGYWLKPTSVPSA